MIAGLPSRNSSTEEFSQRVAHARVAMLDGAGHMPHFEQASNVAKLVGEFLGV